MVPERTFPTGADPERKYSFLKDVAARCLQIAAAWRKGRVDAVVQSTDKNFMVPVGGAVIAASKQNSSLVDAVNKAWL